MWPLLLGGLAIAALVAMAGQNNKNFGPRPPLKPKSGELWHLILAVHPAINSEAEFSEFERALRYIVAQSGQGDIVSIEYPAPNTVDMTLRYIKGAQPMPVNEQVIVGQYTLQVTLSEKV